MANGGRKQFYVDHLVAKRTPSLTIEESCKETTEISEEIIIWKYSFGNYMKVV
jgi:hypothetical protein